MHQNTSTGRMRVSIIKAVLISLSSILLFLLVNKVIENTSVLSERNTSSKQSSYLKTRIIPSCLINTHPKESVKNESGRRSAIEEFLQSDGAFPHTHRGRLLPHIKSQCWYEDIDNPHPYENNSYTDPHKAWLYIDAKNSLKRMTREWEERFKQSSFRHKIKRLRCMPYFYLIGMYKCGTSDMYERITKHPAIAWVMKEPHWWSRMRFGALSPVSLSDKPVKFKDYVDVYDEIADQIAKGRNETIFGDASASTLTDNEGRFFLQKWTRDYEVQLQLETTASQIHRLNSKAKIIIMLRNPIDRLFSDYLYFRINGENPNVDDFHQRVVDSIEIVGKCNDNATMRSCANAPLNIPLPLHVGMYHVFIRDWIRVFGHQQVLVFRLEDYSADRVTAVNRVFKFLDVGNYTTAADNDKIVVNRGSIVIGAMRNDTRRILRRFYKTHNRQLAQLLRDQRFLWKH